MPKGDDRGPMHGSQLWANLPTSLKMTNPRYLDVFVPAGQRKSLPVETSRHAFACVFDGSGNFSDASGPRPVQTEQVGDVAGTSANMIGNRSLVLCHRGDQVTVQAGDEGIRFLLSGKPIEEPVACYGPSVKNPQEQLDHAFSQLRQGTFIKHV